MDPRPYVNELSAGAALVATAAAGVATLALLIGIAVAILTRLLGLRLALLLVLLILLPLLVIHWIVSTLPLTGVRLIGIGHLSGS